jgi:hypothetical protein
MQLTFVHCLSACIVPCCDVLTCIAPIKPLLVICTLPRGRALYAHPQHQDRMKNKRSNLHTFYVCWSTVEPHCAAWVVAQKGALYHLVHLHHLWRASPFVCRVQQSLQIGYVHCGPWCAQNLHIHYIRCHHIYCHRNPLLANLQSWGSRIG